MATNGTIYTGLWVNWDSGRIFGATLTLSAQNAAILNAFVAVLLSFTGTQLWKILTYIFHQVRYKRVCVSGMEHQERAIIRNSPTPGPAAWSLSLQLIVWRRFARTFPLVSFVVLYMVAVAALSILVPSHLHADTVRLLAPLNCGYLPMLESSDATAVRVLKLSQEASLHSQNCYEAGHTSICESYPTSNPTFTTNVSCPFSSTICYTRNGSIPIEMTTRVLNSRKDLGINFEESVQFRSIVTCSILAETNRTERIERAGSADLVRYKFGPSLGRNYTFVYNTLSSQVEVPYRLDLLYSSPGRNSLWTPIPELNRTDADVTVIFFTPNAVMYQRPVLDPLFQATLPFSELTATNNVTSQVNVGELYFSDYFASTIGCGTQYQLCNPNTNSCSALQALRQTFGPETLSQIGLNAVQKVIADRLYHAALWSQLSHVINLRSGSALRASSALMNNVLFSLPNDQYLTELRSWYTTSLSMLHQMVRSYAQGDGTNEIVSEELDMRMCTAQRTPASADTISFALLRLLIVVCLCCCVIGLSYILEPCAPILLRVFGHKPRTAPALWKLDDTLQLQRHLFEALGYGKWSNSNWIPTTSDQPFGNIDFRQYRDPCFAEQVQSPQIGFDNDSDRPEKSAQQTTVELDQPSSK